MDCITSMVWKQGVCPSMAHWAAKVESIPQTPPWFSGALRIQMNASVPEAAIGLPKLPVAQRRKALGV